MSANIKWPRAAALAVAGEILARLEPFCGKITIAGSLRREKPAVGDVEILYVSNLGSRSLDMFETVSVSLAEEVIEQMLTDGTLVKRLSKNGRSSWGARNKLAIHSRSGIPVDLFSTSLDSWWNYLVCRTGPAESNMRIATAALQRGYRWNPYGPGFTRLSDLTPSPPMTSEEEVFQFVRLPFSKPTNRI